MIEDLISQFDKISIKDYDGMIEQFSKVMQVESYVSRFFLESAGWNVEIAVHNYLDTIQATQGIETTADMSRPGLDDICTTSLKHPPMACFAGDLAPWQTRSFRAGTKLPVRIRFQNTGQRRWPNDTQLVFLEGEIMSDMDNIPLVVDPGNCIEVVLVIKVPETKGSHMGTWRLVCSAGYFGEPLFMIVHSSPTVEPATFSSDDYACSREQFPPDDEVAEQLIEEKLSSMSGTNLLGSMDVDKKLHRNFQGTDYQNNGDNSKGGFKQQSHESFISGSDEDASMDNP